MSFAGKVVQRVESAGTDPEWYRRDDVLLIRFTDGTALKVTGHSYEDVSLDYEPMSAQDLRVAARAAQGARERRRVQRLHREWLASLSHEERARRDQERRAKMSPFQLALEDNFREEVRSFALDMSRQAYGSPIPVAPSQQRGRARKS